jgi:uncharacterized membrane protein
MAKTVFERSLPYILIVGGLGGLLSSWMLTVEKIALLADPSYIPPCNVSPLISCGSVMNSIYGSVFGVPNSLFGIIGFSIVITIGFVLLFGANFKRPFWVALQTGMTFALLSVFSLIYVSLFITHTLCPFCMLFWVSTIALYSTTTVYNLEKDNLPMPKFLLPAVKLTLEYKWLPFAVLYGIPFIAILIKFWWYWKLLF